MKKTQFALIAALMVISCQQTDITIDFSKNDMPFDVVMGADISEDDATRINAEGLSLSWADGDSIGVFAGPDNWNVPFTLTSGAGTRQGAFTGRMHQTTSQTLYCYYPYDSMNTNPQSWQVTLEGQVYDGDFTENGVSRNFGKYCYMAGSPVTEFSVSRSTGWPSGKYLSFGYRYIAIVRFKLSNSMSSDISIDRIEIVANESNVLYNLVSINVVKSSFSRTSTNHIGVDLATPLVLKAGSSSDYKYVYMSAVKSAFENAASGIDIVAYGNMNGNPVQLICHKTVSSTHNILYSKRTTISFDMTDSTTVINPHLITIGQTGGKLEIPEFSIDASDWQSGTTVWGDGSNETYCAGAAHTYSTGEAHTATVSCWGTSGSVQFDNLENITSIDFSKF